MNKLYESIMGNRSNNNVSNIMSALRGNPQGLKNSITNNPQYKTFLANNAGKTPEQIAQENGIDINLVRKMLG